MTHAVPTLPSFGEEPSRSAVRPATLCTRTGLREVWNVDRDYFHTNGVTLGECSAAEAAEVYCGKGGTSSARNYFALFGAVCRTTCLPKRCSSLPERGVNVY